jgi:hypothetical protein
MFLPKCSTLFQRKYNNVCFKERCVIIKRISGGNKSGNSINGDEETALLQQKEGSESRRSYERKTPKMRYLCNERK